LIRMSLSPAVCSVDAQP